MRTVKKALFIILFLSLIILPVSAQSTGTGALFDPERYEQIPLKPVLLTRDYSSLPRSYSLKQFMPTPGNQGEYGTCVGWASAFAARTGSESVAIRRNNRTLTTTNAFSPIHLYRSISNDPSGFRGTYTIDAMNFLKNEGAVRQLPNELNMPYSSILLQLFVTHKRYPISDYVRLFGRRTATSTNDERILPVKKSLSEGKPVVIGMNTPMSFHSLRGRELWQPVENPNTNHGGHAMCVVGYDDNKHGGAFEIQNSWGTDWGNGGYIWIRYADFATWVNEAYEIIEDLTNFQEAVSFGASIEIQVDKVAGGMPVTFDRQGFYRTRSSYPSGTEFRFLITNRHPSYVYAFSAESSTPRIERIFPLQGISPILDYSNSTIAWPGEFQWIKLDDVVGTDYLVVLFSKYALDIDSIERRFASERGTFPQRVSRAVGSDFIPFNQAQYRSDSIELSANSRNPRAILGLLLAIDHR